MTPEDLAKQLAELHEQSLTELHVAITQHKEFLLDLVQQTREELHSLASAHRSTAEAQQINHDVTSGGAASTSGVSAVRGVKRRSDETEPDREPAAKPAKRRGRPPKQPKQPAIAEADEEEEQAEQQNDSQQQSVSATVVAGAEDVATAEEATSAPAATRRRTARTQIDTALAGEGTNAPASGRTTRSRRGAATAVEPTPPAASSGRSKRGRKAAAVSVPAAAQLEAIVEEDEQPAGEQQQMLQPSEGTGDAANGEAVLQQQQEQEELQTLAVSPGAGTAALEEVQYQDNEVDADQAQALDATVVHSTAPVAGKDCEQRELELPGPDDDSAASPAADDADQHRSEPAKRVEGDATGGLLPPAAAEPSSVIRPAPKTPGFRLLPSSARKHDSDTPRFVGCASRTSSLSLQQQSAATAAATSGEPVIRLSDADAEGGGQEEQLLDSTSQRRTAGPKAQSLSFGQPLEGPLLEDAASGEANIDATGLAAAADANTGEQPAASGAMNWKAFMSTVRADAAPTPAAIRQRQRSSAAAASAQEAPEADTPAAAAISRVGDDVAQQRTPLSPALVPAPATDNLAAATGPTSCRRVTRSSIQRHVAPSSQALQPDAAELVLAGEQAHVVVCSTPASSSKGKPARSPRQTPPRSSKRRPSAQAAAGTLANHADDAPAEQQQIELPASEAAAADDLNTADQSEGHEEAHDPADDQGMAHQDDDMQEGLRREQEPAEEPASQLEDEVDQQDAELRQVEAATAAQTAACDDRKVAAAFTEEVAAKPSSDQRPASATTNSSKAADPVSAWLAATAVASSGAVGDKAKQHLEAAKDNKAAAAGGRSNLVSGIRSFVPTVAKKEAPAIAAGKVKVKVRALEAAEAARKAEEAKAQEKAARQQLPKDQQHGGKPQGTPSGAVAQSRVAAVERAATGLSGSGGAVRVPAKQQDEENQRPADNNAAQKKAEKEAETAKRALDKAEREDRMKRAEQKRKEEEQKRRQELAEKQRLKEERAAAAAAARGAKGAAPKPAGAGARGADKAHDGKAKQLPASTAATDPSNFKTPAAPKAATRVGAAAAGGGDGSAGASDSPSLTIKLLEPVSTGGKAKAAMGPPAPVGGKTPAAFKTPAPPVSEQEKRNVEALKNSPYVNTGIKRTPYSQQKPDPNSYIISPYRDDDVETPDRSHKPIPDWARSHVLFEALKAQQHTDPDTIFGARQTTCDLADMFADVPSAAPQQHQRHKVRKLGQRTSSGDWSQDRLTWQEEVKYKKDMGYL